MVCDRRTVIGGAWRVESALGYHDLEVGCHIFIPGVRVGVALQSLWGISLTPLMPPPRSVFYVRGRYVQDAYTAPLIPGIISGAQAIARAGSRLTRRRRSAGGSWRDAARLAVTSFALMRASLRTRGAAPGPLLYPPGGTGEIVRALKARIDDAGIVLRLGHAVTGVTVEGASAVLTLDDGSVIRAGQAILTRGSAVPAINGLALPPRDLIRRHWVVVIDDPSPRAFSYLEFNYHPAIERVSDVTRFARTAAGDAVEPSRKILCVYVTNALHQQGQEEAEEVLLDILKRGKWIGLSAVPVASGWWEDLETSRDHRPLALLQAANPGLRVIREINLGNYLVKNLHRIEPGSFSAPGSVVQADVGVAG